MAVIFHLRSYGHLFNPLQRDFLGKLFLPRLPGWRHQGRGVWTPFRTPDPPAPILPASIALCLCLSPSFLSWNQLPSFPASSSFPITLIKQRATTEYPAQCQQHQRRRREEGWTCLRGPCSVWEGELDTIRTLDMICRGRDPLKSGGEGCENWCSLGTGGTSTRGHSWGRVSRNEVHHDWPCTWSPGRIGKGCFLESMVCRSTAVSPCGIMALLGSGLMERPLLHSLLWAGLGAPFRN